MVQVELLLYCIKISLIDQEIIVFKLNMLSFSFTSQYNTRYDFQKAFGVSLRRLFRSKCTVDRSKFTQPHKLSLVRLSYPIINRTKGIIFYGELASPLC